MSRLPVEDNENRFVGKVRGIPKFAPVQSLRAQASPETAEAPLETQECGDCRGSGMCTRCGGKKTTTFTLPEGFTRTDTCSQCDGSGRCEVCKGTGKPTG